MAKSCGIRIGPRRFELVVLEGGARKHRITAFSTGELPPEGEDSVAETIEILREAIKAHNVPVENTGLAIDSGLAAFRTLTLPSLDDGKIEEVLKFEIESKLPQWNIEDVIVDFLRLDKTDAETNLLVTAVPKASLSEVLETCVKANFDPQEVELEATAMVNAALSADICHADDAQILVHIGETSTAVVVMDGGKVRAMRAIHLGALTHDGGPDPEGEEPDAETIERRKEQAVSRIRRELGRTLSGARTVNPIEALYICGWEVPDLVETELQDVPVYELDVFEEDGGQPAQGTAPLVVAYGVALRMLGGGTLNAKLRREELRFSGAFERVELPLAVASLMLVTLLGVFCIFESKQIALRTGDVHLWLQSAINYMNGVPKEGTPGNLKYPWDDLDRFVERVDTDLEISRREQLRQVERMIQLEVNKLDEDLGNTGEVTQPQSALEAMTRVVAMVDELGEEIGRVSIRKIWSETRTGGFGKEESVEVRLDMSFFAANASVATSHYDRFKNALREAEWTTDVSARGTTEFDDGTGIYTDDLSIVCDLSRVESLLLEMDS